MLELLGFALLVAVCIYLLPLLITLAVAGCAVVFCLLMAAWCWVKGIFTPTKKPTK